MFPRAAAAPTFLHFPPFPRSSLKPSPTRSLRIVQAKIYVIKRDGRREEFDREKLVRAVRAACHKRPVDLEQITMLIEDVVDSVEAEFDSEIPSRALGYGVMQRLRNIDQVAYVRFASVYKEFRDVAEFVDEVSSLGKPPK